MGVESLNHRDTEIPSSEAEVYHKERKGRKEERSKDFNFFSLRSWRPLRFKIPFLLLPLCLCASVVIFPACETTPRRETVTRDQLDQAIKNNDLATVEAYADDMRQFDDDVFGRKYLMLASSYGHVELVEFMLKNGAEPGPYVRKNLDTPLHYAAGGGHLEVMQILLDAEADVNARDNFGKTPLHWTADANQPAAAVALLKAGADPSPWSRFGTPLQLAVKKNHIAVEQALIAQGVQQ